MDNTIEKIITADGSDTLYSPHFDEHYHSIHGAIQESRHVFMAAGYRALPTNLQIINILEIGFGTGLNAFLTYLDTLTAPQKVLYTSIEAYPISTEQALSLNYPAQLDADNQQVAFAALHLAAWNVPCVLTPNFTIYKQHVNFLDISLPQNYFHLVYYDAFAPSSQPELWTDAVFSRLYAAMQTEGILVTYCAKGSVKRTLKAAGFEVSALPGPPRKREMTRARKI